MIINNMPHYIPEQNAVNELIDICKNLPFNEIDNTYLSMSSDIQNKKRQAPIISKFMSEYQLNSQEGLALMTLAEALLRIPDAHTVEKLIEDKLIQGDWGQRSKQNNDLMVLLGSTGLKFSKQLLDQKHSLTSSLFKIFSPLSKAAIRHTVKSIIHTFANQFILAENIEQAVKQSATDNAKGIWFSYDMLGESAVSEEDADNYYKAYENAIHALAQTTDKQQLIQRQPGISVKLSAITPKLNTQYWHKTINDVSVKLLNLAVMAQKANIQLTVDAEESWRLDITHEIIERVFSAPELDDYNGFGIVIQAYLTSAVSHCHWAINLAAKNHKKLMVRLVKGAYWDSEIKHAQVNGLESYPVFTRKYHSDLSYTACAHILADEGADKIYTQFGTHNIYTLATVITLMKNRRDFEIQSLFGMCDHAHRHLLLERGGSVRMRVYAPIGSKQDLLAYLVRRILENGANHSVFNAWISEKDNASTLNPVQKALQSAGNKHDAIPLPINLYPDRVNSIGPDLDCHKILQSIQDKVAIHTPTTTPATTEKEIDELAQKTTSFATKWRSTNVDVRAQCLEKAASQLQDNFYTWTAQVMLEGKKTVNDAVSEVRETIDFLNYYAAQARISLQDQILAGPTGEENTLKYAGKGVMVCLSPWNFPMAIFTGQIVAALVAGNCVIAKPAQQTPRIAQMIVDTLHQCGIPKDALALTIGPWGPKLVDLPNIAGVMLTGSTETAKKIQQRIAEKSGPMIPIFAETGGLNVMIADSSALREQLTTDVIQSAFRSAGQRCSALRVLYLPEENSKEYTDAIIGAMKCLNIESPLSMSSDVGPLIDKNSQDNVAKHIEWLDQNATCLYKCPSPNSDTFIGPCAYEIKSLDMLHSEVFGPVLHIIKYKSNELDKVIDAINRSGYGLTLGIHSRIDSHINRILEHSQVGNNYINRDMIGATVGVQPFGGNGLSGTGPKAGGPNMLRRLCNEKTITINTAAAGGNAALINLTSDTG